MHVTIGELMTESGVKFGTSGARGLAADMSDRVCYLYTRGFLQYMEQIGDLGGTATGGGRVAVAGDLRPSTERIVAAVCRAVQDAGHRPLHCGQIPSPAVALYGIHEQIPAIMVTGSHIPADRNGIKFNKAAGEILKPDEEGIRAQQVFADPALFDGQGRFAAAPLHDPERTDAARLGYRARYLEFFPAGCLRGKRLGVYQHSAVGRDELVEILTALGAEVVSLGRSDNFIPVDTEAIRPEDVELARRWAADGEFFALLSTDGDGDRPLLADAAGTWLRGDVAGILCARYLGADSVHLPVSCNSAVEKCGWFRTVRRTRIGSPFVIASMQQATRGGAGVVVGYEANGGFLTDTPVTLSGRTLPALPTRDALLPLLAILHLATQRDCGIADLLEELPARFTASDRLKEFPPEHSRAVLRRFDSGDEQRDAATAEQVFGDLCGTLTATDRTDGLRLTFSNQEVIHLRPSGNAPEFRCYTEAASEQRAQALNRTCLERLPGLVK